jgi:hypothetical protein
MLFLGAFGIFLFFFGIGACLGLIYATWKSRFIIAEIFRDIGRIIIGTASLLKECYTELKSGFKQSLKEGAKEGIELGNKDADAFEARLNTWLEKKGWK